MTDTGGSPAPNFEAEWSARWIQVAKYLSGELTAAEQADFARWAAEDPARAGAIAEARTSWRRRAQGLPAVHVDPALARVLARVRGSSHRPKRVLLGRSSLRQIGYAGIVGALAILVFLGLHKQYSSSAEVPQRYATGAGQRLQVTLANGAHVVLAPRTTLQLTSTTATLTGEAFFMVPHHTRAPFVVRTGAVTTRVLGTSFDVTRYPDQQETRIIVVTGKVAIGAKVMTPVSAPTVARVTDSTITVMHTDDVTPLTAWTRGTLAFDDVPVTVVLASLGRWYGLTFRLMDSTLATQHLTTTLDIRRDRSQVLEVLESALSVRMTAVGDTVILMPQQPLPHSAPARRPGAPPFTLSPEIGR